MQITKDNINLQEEYDKINNIAFSNKLKKIKLKWCNSKVTSAKVVSIGVKNKPKTWKIQHLEISLFNEMSYERFLDILAHEMIHVYLIQNQTANFDDIHGQDFQREKKRINKLIKGLNIQDTENSDKLQVSEHIKVSEVGVVILTKKDKKRIQIYNKNLISKVIKQFEKYTEWIEEYSLIFITVKDKQLMNFPIKRKLDFDKINMFPINKKFYDKLIKNGKIIKEIK